MNGDVIIAYVPALHRGYLELVNRHPGATFGILGRSVLALFPQLARDCRALSPDEARLCLAAIFPSVVVLDLPMLRVIAREATKIVMPHEDVMIELVEEYFTGNAIVWETAFLRWDRRRLETPRKLETETITEDSFVRWMMSEVSDFAAGSSDWWRQVGAFLVIGGQVIGRATNRHLPTVYTPYIDGDPRSSFDAGERFDLSSAIHAEASLIARMAKSGRSVEGATIYVTTFPCPACAYLIAECGIRRLYYRDGYSLVNGERILVNAGVQVVKVVE